MSKLKKKLHSHHVGEQSTEDNRDYSASAGYLEELLYGFDEISMLDTS